MHRSSNVIILPPPENPAINSHAGYRQNVSHGLHIGKRRQVSQNCGLRIAGCEFSDLGIHPKTADWSSIEPLSELFRLVLQRLSAPRGEIKHCVIFGRWRERLCRAVVDGMKQA